MTQDTLYLLEPGFEDPAYPGKRFYCWHCALIEGVLVSFPELATNLKVERVAWPRPRRKVIDVVGEAYQSLPLLLLGDASSGGLATQSFKGRLFVSNKDEILRALSVRHGFPEPHP